jgi:hypothetical protein
MSKLTPYQLALRPLLVPFILNLVVGYAVGSDPVFSVRYVCFIQAGVIFVWITCLCLIEHYYPKSMEVAPEPPV